MRTRFRTRLLATVLAACGPALHGQGLRLVPGVAEVETDSIRDVAVAAVDRDAPVIYVNPQLARRYGPLLTRFFVAHEYGHVQLRHTRAGLFSLSARLRDSVLVAQELEADCYAAQLEGADAVAATEAALRFFARLGPFRYDAQHPSGAQRAGTLLRCLPLAPDAQALRQGDTGVERGPVSGEPVRIRFAVRSAALEGRSYGKEAVLWLDGRRVGVVSNLRSPGALVVDQFVSGIHNYRLTLDTYGLAGMLGLSGTVTSRGQVLLQDGDRWVVEWEPGGEPRLVRERPAS